MSAVLRDSTLYSNIYTNHYITKASDHRGRWVFSDISFTTVSPSTQNDTYNVAVIPAYAKVIDLYAITEGLGTSVTVALGDSGSSTRYKAATAMAASGNSFSGLDFAGQNYVPTADTIVVATVGGGTPTVAKSVRGFIAFVPGA